MAQVCLAGYICANCAPQVPVDLWVCFLALWVSSYLSVC